MAIDFQADDDKLDFQPLDFQEESSEESRPFVGGLEGVLNVASSFGAAIPTGIRMLGELMATGSLEEAISRSESTAEAATYQPRTQTGKNIGKAVTDTLADYQADVANKYAADQEFLTKQKMVPTESNYKAENLERFVGELLGGLYAPGIPIPRARKPVTADTGALKKLDVAAAAETESKAALEQSRKALDEAMAKQQDANIVERLKKIDEQQVFKEDLGARHDAAIEQRLRGIDEQLNQNDAITQQLAARDAAAQDAGIVDRLKGIDKDLESAPDPAAIAKSHDQLILNKLQRLDESIVDRDPIQKQTLHEMQTRELQDRLQRIDDTMSGIEDYNARYATQDLAKRLEQVNAERGREPIYVDPQGQAFRGDPNEMKARYALEQQTKAFEAQIESGTEPIPGEPLSGLVDPERPPRSGGMSRAEVQEINRKAETPTMPPMPRVKGKQKGGVTLDLLTLGLLPKSNKLRAMKPSKDGTFIPEDRSPNQFQADLAKAQGEADGRSFKNMDSGADLTAAKRGSTAIRMAGDLIQNAYKRADLAIRKVVFPAEQALKGLTASDLATLGEVMKREMFNGKQYTLDQLSHFKPEMLNAYRKMREMFDKSLDIQNEGRAARGLPPVKPIEAYLSSRWQGDFRRPLYDANGKLVWYLAGNTKKNLNAQTRAILKDHPTLVFDAKKDHTVRFWNRKTDLQSAFSTMIDVLGRDDPAVAKMQKYMEDQTVGEGAKWLAQEKHFKAKGNIKGFVGDRPELSLADYTDRNIPLADKIPMGHGRNAEMREMMQQQIQYAKNGIKWAEMQKVADQMKTLINDPKLQETQPRNVEYIRDYWKNAVGYGEHKAIRMLTDGLRDFGISPEPFDKAVGGMKSYFILSKLAINAGYALASAIQLGMVVPHLFDIAVKHKSVSNPIKAVATGAVGGLVMGTGHMYNAMAKNKFQGVPGADFLNRAYRYAEDNGITARSVYDESPIDASFSAVGATGRALSKTMTIPETYMRSIAFTTIAQFLKDTGKFKDEATLFREAERRTNMSMVDYAATERPMVFSKLGSAGNFLNTLQTYGWNYYNQLSYFAREAGKGNVLPLMASLGMQYALAGAMGAPGVEDLYKAYMQLRDALPANMFKKVHDNEFFNDPKLWLLKNGGVDAVYGWLSDKTGLGMTTRLAAPGIGSMLQSPVGPATDIAKQALSAGKAAMDPNSTNLAQAGMNSAPAGLQGLLETAPFMEGHTYNTRINEQTGERTTVPMRTTKLGERSGLIERNANDEAIRKWGLRSTREMAQRDVNYGLKRDEDVIKDKTKELSDKFYDAVRRNDKDKAQEYLDTYVYFTGKKITQQQFNQQIEQEFLTDYERKSGKKTLASLQHMKRAKELFEIIERETK